jgi:hypothetical protein
MTRLAGLTRTQTIAAIGRWSRLAGRITSNTTPTEAHRHKDAVTENRFVLDFDPYLDAPLEFYRNESAKSMGPTTARNFTGTVWRFARRRRGQSFFGEREIKKLLGAILQLRDSRQKLNTDPILKWVKALMNDQPGSGYRKRGAARFSKVCEICSASDSATFGSRSSNAGRACRHHQRICDPPQNVSAR